jgi:peptidyl-prolyl cis-trans isomerase-like 4
MEGDDTLEKLNTLYCDEEHRPFTDVRVLHTYVLDDPFDDPAPLADLVPPDSPIAERPKDERVKARLKYDDGTEDTKVATLPG